MTKPIKKQVRNIKKHYETAVFHFYIGLFGVPGFRFIASEPQMQEFQGKNSETFRNI